MDGWGWGGERGELTRRGEAFALATVVWRQGRWSSKPGSRAIITTEGELRGWIGGACAEPVVIREAQQVIADGTARLLLLGTPEQFGAAVPDGMRVVPISCQSEGALEVYIEPVLPVPHLVIVGESPMARTLAGLAGTLGWRTDLVSGRDFATAGTAAGDQGVQPGWGVQGGPGARGVPGERTACASCRPGLRHDRDPGVVRPPGNARRR